jgi:hypothetical protein
MVFIVDAMLAKARLAVIFLIPANKSHADLLTPVVNRLLQPNLFCFC